MPLEQLHTAIASLGGEPSVEQDTWVAIARLNDAPAAQSAGAKWAPDKTFTTKQVALTCKQEAFWRFLREERHSDCHDEEDAAMHVREFCDVRSRSEIETNPKARERWHLLYSAFDAWMQVPA